MTMTARINDTMLIPVVLATPRRFFLFVVVACCALNQVEMQLGNCGSSYACEGVIVTACAQRRWTVRAFGANAYGAFGTGASLRGGSGDRHHASKDPDEMIRHE